MLPPYSGRRHLLSLSCNNRHLGGEREAPSTPYPFSCVPNSLRPREIESCRAYISRRVMFIRRPGTTAGHRRRPRTSSSRTTIPSPRTTEARTRTTSPSSSRPARGRSTAAARHNHDSSSSRRSHRNRSSQRYHGWGAIGPSSKRPATPSTTAGAGPRHRRRLPQ